MRVYRIAQSAACAAFVLAVCSKAQATTEPPNAYDARSVGAGSTGVAYIHNGASIYHNPALLQGIERAAGTLVISPSRSTMTVPLDGPNTEVSSEGDIFPMFLIGGAYRLTDEIVVGLAAFPTAGFGSTYKNAQTPAGPTDLEMRLMIMEATPAISVALDENLALGVGYRITYMKQVADQVMPGPAPGSFAVGEMDLSGTSFNAFHIGLFARPAPGTRIGLSYRNKFTTKLDGTLDVGGQSLDVTSEFASPHSFKFGVAQQLFNERLMLTAEIKRSLFADSNKSLDTKVAMPSGEQTMSLPLEWENTWTLNAGGELFVTEQVPVRLGYSVTQTATSESYASYYSLPPGILHSLHAGAGLRLDHWEVDFGGFYSFGGSDVEPLPGPTAAHPGRYENTYVLGSASVTYRL
jgi:long-chain fatty acid transport protein